MPYTNFNELKGRIDVTPIKDTENLLTISVETKDRHEGMHVVNEIIHLYSERCKPSYNRTTKIRLDQMVSTNEQLVILRNDINQSRKVLENLGGRYGQFDSAQLQAENELRISRTLDYLNDQETRHAAILERYLGLKKEFELSRLLDVVQPAKEPTSPKNQHNSVIVTVAGILGIIVDILAAFIRNK